MSKVKIVSGWSNPGGSTIHHIGLTNLLNENGFDCTFYGPHKWHMDKCKSSHIKDCKLTGDDILISHFIQIPTTNVKKHILSCHETNLFPLKQISLDAYDVIHFVSDYQKKWHGVIHPSVVIPGLIDKVKWSSPNNKTAGVIGSIDEHKQTHVSVQRAFDAGYEKVLLFGQINDKPYFDKKIAPMLLTKNVSIMNYCEDKEKMYNSVEAIYHSSKRECLPTVQGECINAGIPYFGLECNMRNVEDYEFDDKEILSKWRVVLNS
jgi:hypothetical protein